MNNRELLGFLLMIGLLVLLVLVLLALTAGSIITQIFAPVPSIAGPLGAGVALVVFIYLLGKTAHIIGHFSDI